MGNPFSRGNAQTENKRLQERISALKEQNVSYEQRIESLRQQMSLRNARDANSHREKLDSRHSAELSMLQREMAVTLREMQVEFQQKMQERSEQNTEEIERQREEFRQERAKAEHALRESRRRDLDAEATRLQQHLDETRSMLHVRQEQLEQEEYLLNELRSQLERDMAARARFEHPSIAEECKKIVMLGNTGDGKSTLGNRLLGDESRKGDKGPFKTSSRAKSETQEIQVAFLEGDSVCIIDTPGGGDSGGDELERQHATNLVTFLRGSNYINGFLLVRNLHNPRLSGGDQKILNALHELLGPQFWLNTILVMTRVDFTGQEEDMRETGQELLETISSEMKVDYEVLREVPVIGIGKENFREKRSEILQAVLACNGNQPYAPDDEKLVAPVERLQADYDAKQQQVGELRLAIEDLKQKEGYTQGHRDRIDHMIQDLLGVQMILK